MVKAIGVDLWQRRDQSGNAPRATLENARAEGVEERVEILDGDLRDLPFDDGAFDVVLSSLVLHNVQERDEREAALSELARVLSPGGYLAIVDIPYTYDYAGTLRECGLVARRRDLLRNLAEDDGDRGGDRIKTYASNQ